jgi:sugar diacid utilization regulator
MDIPFTLTDLQGVVVASTGGQHAGQVDRRAVRLLERSDPARESADARGAETGGSVYLPLRLSGRVAGVLIAHGDPERVRTVCRVAVIAIGLALDFSEAASSLGRDSVNPGLLLYRLLRGSRDEAQQARIVAAIFGWNLFVQRVAIVIIAPESPRAKSRGLSVEDPMELLRRVLGGAARTTPFGQVDESQWVVLAHHEPHEPWASLRQLALRIQTTFISAGWDAEVGIGEPHLPVYPVLAARNSYREAIYAARLGPRVMGGHGPYELRGLGPAAFFAPSSPSRRNLAGLALHPLRDHPVVLETLRAYLASNMSVADTAGHLGVHRHTVRNHLGRVSALTGLDPRSLEGAVQLKLALLVLASEPDGMEGWRSR